MSAESGPGRREQVASLWAATELSRDLDLERLAQRVVESVTAVTDFAVATLTVRHGESCRRIAAAGVDDARIGLETPYAGWRDLLREDYRQRSSCFVIPPQATGTDWMQTVPVAAPGAGDGREVWTTEHGLIVELLGEDGERIGFLSVDAPRSGCLPDDTELEHIELFARQAQSALRNAHLHEEVRRQRDAAEALNAVGRAVSGSLELREVLRLCCDAVVEHSAGDRASIYLHDPETGRFRTVMSRGSEPDPRLWEVFRNLPPMGADEVPVFGQVMRTGEPALIERVTTEHVDTRALELFSLKSVAVYPMQWGAQLTGLLLVDTFREHIDFPAHEVDLVGRIAGQAAVAIHQAQLHEAARASAARADELYELTKQMTRTFDFDTIFRRIIEAVTARTDAFAVGLMEIDAGELVLRRSHLVRGDDDGPAPYQRLPIADMPPALWQRLSDDGSVVVPDVVAAGLQPYVRPQARSLLLAGHRDEGELALLLHVSSDRAAAFTRDDAAFVEGLVEVAALAMRNARLYDEARLAAERDGLTGLKNRRMYGIEVPPLLARATPTHPVALAVLDIDDFKAVNDLHGHAAGDAALEHVADRIRRSVREDDSAYRLGGEEFAVVMPAASADEAVKVIDRVRRAVGVSRTGLVKVTISSGIAVAPLHGTNLDALFRAADAALYAAKAAGKNTVHLADERRA